SQMETCWVLSPVNGSPFQSSQRSHRRRPASWAIRSSSAGQTYRNGNELCSRRTLFATSERPRHEDAVRVGSVVPEGLAVIEPEPLVQLPCREEEVGGPGLQAQPGEAHPLRLDEDVLQQLG